MGAGNWITFASVVKVAASMVGMIIPLPDPNCTQNSEEGQKVRRSAMKRPLQIMMMESVLTFITATRSDPMGAANAGPSPPVDAFAIASLSLPSGPTEKL